MASCVSLLTVFLVGSSCPVQFAQLVEDQAVCGLEWHVSMLCSVIQECELYLFHCEYWDGSEQAVVESWVQSVYEKAWIMQTSVLFFYYYLLWNDLLDGSRVIWYIFVTMWNTSSRHVVLGIQWARREKRAIFLREIFNERCAKEKGAYVWNRTRNKQRLCEMSL